jgi:hypothetical protein
MSVGVIGVDGLLRDTTGACNKTMRCRGEASPNDDVHEFKRNMEKRGHVVELHEKQIGEAVERKHPGFNGVQKAYEYQLGEEV